MMKKSTLTLSMFAAVVAASTALAGPAGPGPGYGPGYGPGCVEGAAPGSGCGYGPGAGMGPGGGMGPGHGMGRGHGMGGRGYGQALLTPEERAAHMTAMHSLKTVDECNAYLAEHQQLIAERAKEKGLAPPPQRGNACERMKARGRFG
jgi:hypothetical protein